MSNELRCAPPRPADCPCVDDPAELAERYSDVLGDESRLSAPRIEALYLPTTAAEVAGAMQAVRNAGWRCVVSAGRTGITGAGVPIDAEAVISLAGMKRLLAFGRDEDGCFLRAEPGVTLHELSRVLQHKDLAALPPTGREALRAYTADAEQLLWFPVDPTEQTATIGGAVACNASGARTYRYGATRDWVRGLEVVLPTGERLHLRRGEARAENGMLRLVRADGTVREIRLPEIRLPRTKCTAGYYLTPTMDAVDLFIGSEGTLGAVTAVELRLAPRPRTVLGVIAVVPDEERALMLVENARASEQAFDAIEYFDVEALKLLEAKRAAEGAASTVPNLRLFDGAAVYLELSGEEDTIDEAAARIESLLDAVDSSGERTWAAIGVDELEKQKAFRHAVPEAVNALIGRRKRENPSLHKVGTDMAVPDEKLRAVFALYRRGLQNAGLEAVVFGHIGDNHVHVNILPRDETDMRKAKALYREWAQAVVEMGGAVSAEHGIGRIKKPMLAIQYPPAVLEGMRALRAAFDPEGMLGPGVLV